MQLRKVPVSLILDILVYVSLLFLLLYLYRNDLIYMPELYRPSFLVISIGLLLGGYSVDTKAWQMMAKAELRGITYKHAFESNGKFIFGKYIPGKLWNVLGRAGYLKSKYNRSFVSITFLSFFHQLIIIVSGLLLGLGVLYGIEVTWFWTIVIITLAIIVVALSTYKLWINIFKKMLCRLLKENFTLPRLSSARIIWITLTSLSSWILWSLAFYLLIISTHQVESLSITAGLLFPLSAVFGILVLIAPGGLGFREGLLTVGLVAMGINSIEAASIAVLSRLWFLAGEMLFFVIATISSILDKRKVVTK